MAFTFAETVTTFPAGAGTTVTGTLASISVGDLIIATIGAYSAFAGTIDSCTDSLGNTYVAAGGPFVLGANVVTYRTFVCLGAASGGASPTVTGTYSTSVPNGSKAIYLTRYNITNLAATVDKESSGSGTTSTLFNSGTVVTTATDLLYGFNNYSVAAPVSPGGWTNRDGAAHEIDDLIGATAGSYAYQPTTNTLQDYTAEIIAFTETVAATGWGPLLGQQRNRLVVGA